MIIDLKKVNYYYLTAGDPRKVDHITEILDGYKLCRFDANMNYSKRKSGAISYHNMINLALFHQSGEFQPFILLEDDVSLYRPIPSFVTVPDDADILYIGLSPYGREYHEGEREVITLKNSVKFRYIDSEIVQIFNMLSTHSVVVCSLNGAKIFQECLLADFCKNSSYDHSLAENTSITKYALKEPVFYQDVDYGGQSCTYMKIE